MEEAAKERGAAHDGRTCGGWGSFRRWNELWRMGELRMME